MCGGVYEEYFEEDMDITPRKETDKSTEQEQSDMGSEE